MIVGGGLLAKSFVDIDEENILIFASGVSNSLEDRLEEFERERLLLEKYLDLHVELNTLFVYFSTCSIYDPSKIDSYYIKHKLRMEQLVKERSKKYLIFRASNIVGKGGNRGLLLNYLYESLMTGREVVVHTKAYRNLLDIDDLKLICRHYIDSGIVNKTINAAYKDCFSVLEIIRSFEAIFSKKFNSRMMDEGGKYSINVDAIYSLFEASQSKEDYLNQLIRKYYH